MNDKNQSTDQKRWAKIKALFREANAKPHGDRESYVRSQSGDDPDLFEEVMDLLRSAEETDYDLASIVPKAASQLSSTDFTPKRIGQYRIVELVGEGGMGSVYLAERDDSQYQQQVAIKVLSNQMPSRELIQRFRSERQILANLDHPHIAKLLDGGETDKGIPYLVMEYVQGTPLHEYCDTHKLSAAQRLQLVLKVCSAVQHAHQNFVIHRDLKSSNILVTEQGEPKLLDFGIAKIQESSPGLLHTIAETKMNARVLTPQNASPEQVLGAKITTATDVYALGLLMYESLAGHSAYELESLTSSELGRVICDVNPPKPSTKVSDLGSSDCDIAALRNTTLTKLKKYLSGDLDTIVLKALRKEPERRYSTVKELSDDINRYLNRLPVQARPDSFSYRFQKFVDRNKAALAGVFAAGIVLVSLVVFYTVQLAEERDSARVARDQALLEAEKAEQVSDFLTEIFVAASPARAQGRELTAGEILDAAVERVAVDLKDQPEVVAHLYRVMGGSYQWLGDYEKTENLRRITLDLRHQIGDPLMIANAHDNLGVILRIRGQYQESEAQIRRAMEIYTSELESPHKDIADIYNNYAQILRSVGRTAESVEYSRLAVKEALVVHGEEHSETADNMNNLAVHLDNDGKVVEAVQWYEKALAINQKVLGDKHPDTANSLANYGLQLYKLARYPESEPLLLQSLDIRTEVVGPDHDLTAHSLELLGLLYNVIGDFDKAIHFGERAVANYEKNHSEEHPRTMRGMRNLGRIYATSGRQGLAEKNLKAALSFFESQNNNFNRCWTRARLGESYFYADKMAEAKENLSIANQCWLGFLPDSPYRAELLPFLAEVTDDQKRAYEIAKEAMNLASTTLHSEHPSTARGLLAMARVSLRNGEPEEAWTQAQQSVDILSNVLFDGHWELASARTTLGDIKFAQGDETSAMTQWRLAADAMRSHLGDNDPRTQAVLRRLEGNHAPSY